MSKYPQTQEIVFEALSTIFAKQRRFQNVGQKCSHFFQDVVENYRQFDNLAEILEDDTSKRILIWAIQYRIAVYFFCDKKIAGELFPPMIGANQWSNYVRDSKELDVRDLKLQLDVDVVENWILNGYVYPGVCEICDDDIVLDCGAFNGNSSLSLARQCDDGGRVYAFEPNPSVFNILKDNIESYSQQNIYPVNLGVSESKGKIRFRSAGAASNFDPNGNIEVDTISIDEFVEEHQLEKIDFLKFDVEGSELNALKGATKTIRKYRPKIAISVYHLHQDLWLLTSYILKLCSWYKVYLKHNAVHDGEIVLFAVPIK